MRPIMIEFGLITAIICFAVFMVHQVVIPLFQNRKIFPMFRSSAEIELMELEGTVAEERVRAKTRQVKGELRQVIQESIPTVSIND